MYDPPFYLQEYDKRLCKGISESLKGTERLEWDIKKEKEGTPREDNSSESELDSPSTHRRKIKEEASKPIRPPPTPPKGFTGKVRYFRTP